VTLVVDASAVVAALVDTGRDGRWAEGLLTTPGLAAPHLLPVEVVDVLRRAASSGEISHEVAALAHGDLHDLALDLFAFRPVAARVWDLRGDLSSYDARYVALAELLDAPLATLDRRLAGAPGPRCHFLRPDG
jgi:predicted nucleic acid-binding protein